MIPCFYLCVDNCDYSSLDLKVGLEIHQQLATNRKLFCKCSQIETDEYDGSFSRKLRISKSELGEYDPAAIFEHSKEKKMIYFKSHKNSCLVEQDEIRCGRSCKKNSVDCICSVVLSNTSGFQARFLKCAVYVKMTHHTHQFQFDYIYKKASYWLQAVDVSQVLL